MRRSMIIGLLLLGMGLADAGFWIQAEREYQLAPRPLPASMSREAFAAQYPSLSWAYRFIRHDPYEPDRPDKRMPASRLAGHRIIGHALLGMMIVFFGGGLVLAGLRNRFLTVCRRVSYTLAGVTLFTYLFVHPLLMWMR